MREKSTGRKKALIGLLTAGLAGTAGFGLLHPAQAGGQDSGIIIFRGDTKPTSGITIVNWGSGTVVEEPQIQFSGTVSYKIVTHGLYQGASLQLAKPVDLAPYLANKNAYLQFVFQLPEPVNPNQTRRGPGGGGFPGSGSFPGGKGGGSSFPGSGGFPGGGIPGGGGGQGGSGFPGGGFGGGRGGQGGRQTQQPQYQRARNIENIRVLLVTNGGKTVETLIPVESGRDMNNWKSLNVAVGAIPDLKADDAQIKEIRLFADAPGTLYLGQVRVAIDATPISVDRISDKPGIPRNVTYTYRAGATSGIIPLKFSWDFDDRDGIQEEKVGRAVNFAYRKTGEHTATLTVTDLYGMRPPVVRKFKVYITQ